MLGRRPTATSTLSQASSWLFPSLSSKRHLDAALRARPRSPWSRGGTRDPGRQSPLQRAGHLPGRRRARSWAASRPPSPWRRGGSTRCPARGRPRRRRSPPGARAPRRTRAPRWRTRSARRRRAGKAARPASEPMARQHRLGRELLVAVVAVDRDPAGRGQHAAAGMDGDLVLLHQHARRRRSAP